MLAPLPSAQFWVLSWMMLFYTVRSARADTIFIEFPPPNYTLPISTALNIRYRIRYDGLANLQFAQVWVTGPEANDASATTNPSIGILSNTTKPVLPPWNVKTVWKGTTVEGTYFVHVGGTAMVNQRGIQTPYPMEQRVRFSVQVPAPPGVARNNSGTIRPRQYSYPIYEQPLRSSANSLKHIHPWSEAISAVLVGTAAIFFGYFLC